MISQGAPLVGMMDLLPLTEHYYAFIVNLMLTTRAGYHGKTLVVCAGTGLTARHWTKSDEPNV